MKLTFRPHHFLCTLGYEGKGYSVPFTDNYTQIAAAIKANEDVKITVVGHTDSICGPCPHKRGKACTKEAYIQSLDQRHAAILNLEPGDELSWAQAKERLRTYMTVDAFHHACQGCEWKDLGLCETALKKLHAHDQKTHA